MKRFLILVPILVAGCSQEPAKPAAAAFEPTVLILQCDGEVSSREAPSVQQRRTYRIDFQAKTVNGWNPTSNTWDVIAGENTIEISDSRITRRSQTPVLEDGSSLMELVIVDRELGTVMTHRVIVDGARYENTFSGQCVKVDEPSTERAF